MGQPTGTVTIWMVPPRLACLSRGHNAGEKT